MYEIINSYVLSRSILLIVFLIFTIVSFFPLRNKIPLSCQILLTISLMSIILLKPFQTPDYENYINAFYSDIGDSLRFEPAWNILKGIIKLINGNIVFIVVVYALLGIILKLSIINRMSPFVWISLLVWLSHTFILHDLIQIRASVAAGLFLWAIYFRCIKEKRKCLWCIFIGIMFHYSMIIAFFIFLLSKNKSYKNFYVLTLMFALVFGCIGLSLGDFIPMAFVRSDEAKDVGGIITKMNIFRCLYAFFLWEFYSKIKRLNRYFLLLLKVYTVGCCVMFLFSRPAIIGLRVSEFLCVTEIILIPMILYLFPKKQRLYYRFVPILSAILLFISSYTSSLYFPYIYK